MNAYELADKLQETEPYYSTDYKLFDKAATVLRQQADRIAELEKLLEHSIGSDCREMRYIQEIENKDERIAELEKYATNGNEILVDCDTHMDKLQKLVLEKDKELKRYKMAWNMAENQIAELEKDLKKYDQLAWDDLSNSKTIWCDCGDGITADSGSKCGVCASTPQTKPLSDEEIEQIAKQHLAAYAQFIGAGEVCYEGEIEFARAIEERHGIK